VTQPLKHLGGSHACRPGVVLLSFLSLFILFFQTGSAAVQHSVTLALLGDIVLGRGVDPSPRTMDILSADIAASDLALANLESPLSEAAPAHVTGYDLCTSGERAEFLKTWGLDLLSLANNHQNDCSSDGLEETSAILRESGLAVFGPQIRPVYREINGIKLAFLALDDFSSPVDLTATETQIKNARANGAVVVVSIHWGMEYQGGASNRQKLLAEKFAEAGASLIWGHHPHVLQPIDWLNTGQGRTLVLYSLGNALFDQPGLPDTRQSALALVRISDWGIQSVTIHPFLLDITNSRLVEAGDEMKKQILDDLGLK